MAIIMDGKLLAEEIKKEVKQEVENLRKNNIIPKLPVIMVGEDSASKIYVKNKSKACYETQIEFEEFILPENISMKELLQLINELNSKKDVDGILVQSPLPEHLDAQIAFETIAPEKDVDGFTTINVGNLVLNKPGFISCTPFGIIKLLEKYKIELSGANVVILGRSNIVGKPLFQCLLNKDATVTVCHSKTKNIKQITSNADIVISAIGKPKFVTTDMIKDGAIVIDVGINRVDGKVVGDVDFENVKEKASYITPVPGGVGPMTIAMLLYNVLEATKNKLK